MKQTAVYLRDDQVKHLKKIAARLGRSEADLIREGVDFTVGRYDDAIGECTWPSAPRGGQLADRTDELLAEGFGETRWSL